MSLKSDGYFMAKREMVEAIDRRISNLQKQMDSLEQTSENVDKHRCLKTSIDTLENMRYFVRNVMLYDTRNDEKEK